MFICSISFYFLERERVDNPFIGIIKPLEKSNFVHDFGTLVVDIDFIICSFGNRSWREGFVLAINYSILCANRSIGISTSL